MPYCRSLPNIFTNPSNFICYLFQLCVAGNTNGRIQSQKTKCKVHCNKSYSITTLCKCLINYQTMSKFSFILRLFCYFFLISSVNITFIDKEGKQRPVRGKVGDNVLYLAHRYGIELEGKKMTIFWMLVVVCLFMRKFTTHLFRCMWSIISLFNMPGLCPRRVLW